MAQIEELERYGKRYLRCSECEYGSFNEEYVKAHVEGPTHRPPPPAAQPDAVELELEPETQSAEQETQA